MAEWIDYSDKVRKYFKPTPKEMIGLAIAIITTAFIISFNEWGVGNTFDLEMGLLNYSKALLIVAITFLTFDSAQRLWGLGVNYRVEYKLWSIGLLIGVLVAFLTDGSVWVILPSGFIVHHLTSHRLGWFRYGINYFGQGLTAWAGPMACTILLMIVKAISAFFPHGTFDKMVAFLIVFIITQMLPIPPLAGSKIYWGSRMFYAFAFPAIVVTVMLLSVDMPAIASIVLSLILAVLLWLIYYYLFERFAWRGPG